MSKFEQTLIKTLQVGAITVLLAGALVIAGGLWQTAKADGAPVTRMAETALEFDTLEQAAIKASRYAAALSSMNEYGGAVVQCSDTGKFYFTEPVTENQDRRVSFQAVLPKVCKVVGLYHSHPLNDGKAHQFSDLDKAMGDKFDLPMYIGVRVDGSVRQYVKNKVGKGDSQRVVATGSDLSPVGVASK